MDRDLALRKALTSLDGLSVGDAFGELFFRLSPYEVAEEEHLPGSWPWTDDTHMALSIVETLARFGRIEQDYLAQAFARRYVQDPWRGYAGGAARLLGQLARGGDWRDVAHRLFGGGS